MLPDWRYCQIEGHRYGHGATSYVMLSIHPLLLGRRQCVIIKILVSHTSMTRNHKSKSIALITSVSLAQQNWQSICLLSLPIEPKRWQGVLLVHIDYLTLQHGWETVPIFNQPTTNRYNFISVWTSQNSLYSCKVYGCTGVASLIRWYALTPRLGIEYKLIYHTQLRLKWTESFKAACQCVLDCFLSIRRIGVTSLNWISMTPCCMLVWPYWCNTYNRMTCVQ